MAIDIEAQKQLFKNLVSKNIHRDGIDELMNWLENETDFFTAPASTRFHCAEPGGLCLHSLNVARETVRLARTYNYSSDDTERKSPLFTEEQLYLVSLFHDICKTNFYKVGTKNQKNEATGQWEKVPFYQCEETVFVGGNGHGDKSVFLLAQSNCPLRKWRQSTTTWVLLLATKLPLESATNTILLLGYSMWPMKQQHIGGARKQEQQKRVKGSRVHAGAFLRS